MSTWRKMILATTSAVVILFGGGLAAIAVGRSPTADVGVPTVTPQQQQDLRFTRDEERMALDLYRLLADRYEAVPIFETISRSEQRHFDAVGNVLVRYDVQDPSAGKAAGVYTDATIQRLYDGWKAQGLKSSDEALKAAIALETRDIADLERLAAKDNPADVEWLYTHLLAASRHHLSAFTAVSEGDVSGTGCPRMGTMWDLDDRGRGTDDGSGFGDHGRRNGSGPMGHGGMFR
ncbi:DUF2202 domain-containing protein [Kribbella ginsengisoli]|uniref:DUF2202 domain-containing protein n=1 Tax=Kribbella ginsengisoli TaxID=363865 RepID=A0ABP6XP41_9ACTN